MSDEIQTINDLIEDNKGMSNNTYDVVFMKQKVCDEMRTKLCEYHEEPTEEMRVLPLYGCVGRVSGIEIMIYDEDNKDEQLLDYAKRFFKYKHREPNVLLVK